MARKHPLFSVLFQSVLLLVLLQAARWLLDPFIPQGRFPGQMCTMALMALLSLAVLWLARCHSWSVSFFPERFTRNYRLVATVFAVLLAGAPANFTPDWWRSVLLVIYGSLVTPFFEEILFRGIIWNRVGKVGSLETVRLV